jgi:glycyl-tRNA synthetase
MKTIYENSKGLVHWTEREIKARERFTQFFADEISAFLRNENKMWEIERTEGPIMIPRSMINPNYTDEDLWTFAQHTPDETSFAARPETTPATYAWMVNRLQNKEGLSLPYCCWQIGKSFRNEENDAIRLSQVRLREFYQMEFQCAYGESTKNDYQEKCLEPVRLMLEKSMNRPTRIVESDRLPSYSIKTMDIEVDCGHRWMEVCSISLRTDFPIKFEYHNKKMEKQSTGVYVLEIAIGMCRVVSVWSGQVLKEID